MKIESDVIHIVSFINVTKIVTQRAGPSRFTQQAGAGRKKSASVHLYCTILFKSKFHYVTFQNGLSKICLREFAIASFLQVVRLYVRISSSVTS